MGIDWFSIIIITLVAVVGLYAAYIQIKTKRQGIETQAQVMDVIKEWNHDGDSPSLEYKYVIKYTNKAGEVITTCLGGMMNNNKELEPGDLITVRYLPYKQEYPIMVKNPR